MWETGHSDQRLLTSLIVWVDAAKRWPLAKHVSSVDLDNGTVLRELVMLRVARAMSWRFAELAIGFTSIHRLPYQELQNRSKNLGRARSLYAPEANTEIWAQKEAKEE